VVLFILGLNLIPEPKKPEKKRKEKKQTPSLGTQTNLAVFDGSTKGSVGGDSEMTQTLNLWKDLPQKGDPRLSGVMLLLSGVPTAMKGFSYEAAPHEEVTQNKNFQAEREKTTQKNKFNTLNTNLEEVIRSQNNFIIAERGKTMQMNKVNDVHPTKSPVTKLLLVVSMAFKKGMITEQEKGKLKDLIILGNPILNSSLEVFEIDQDFDEFIDTLKRIVKLV